jgi:hypothetical protein
MPAHQDGADACCMRRRNYTALPAAAGLAAALLLTACSSGASSHPAARITTSPAQAPAASTVRVTDQKDSNWAGYLVTSDATKKTSFSAVSGSWTEPAADCEAGWLGLGTGHWQPPRNAACRRSACERSSSPSLEQRTTRVIIVCTVGSHALTRHSARRPVFSADRQRRGALGLLRAGPGQGNGSSGINHPSFRRSDGRPVVRCHRSFGKFFLIPNGQCS